MNHQNYDNWTIDYGDMNYSDAENYSDDGFDPSRCGHVDDHYHQVRVLAYSTFD